MPPQHGGHGGSTTARGEAITLPPRGQPWATAERLPGVIGAARLTSFTALAPAAIEVMAPAGHAIPDSFWHRRLLAGRGPDPGSPGQVDISFTVARAERVAVGGTLRVVLLGASGKPVPLNGWQGPLSRGRARG